MKTLSALEPRPILVTGADGQIGTELRRLLRGRSDVVFANRRSLDLENFDAVRAWMKNLQPRTVINAAAYTAVDAAEDDVDGAMAVNAEAPDLLARLCASYGASLIHFSTDYVFAGEVETPRVESDPVTARSIYGISKAEGERRILAGDAAAVILRTAWLYAPGHGNFMTTMLRLFRERDGLGVVHDQIGTPTPACLPARAALFFALRSDSLEFTSAYRGIFHCTASGRASWWEYAREIHRHARRLDEACIGVNIKPISSAEYPTRAPRPAFSVLNSDKLARVMGETAPYWRSAVGDGVHRELVRLPS